MANDLNSYNLGNSEDRRKNELKSLIQERKKISSIPQRFSAKIEYLELCIIKKDKKKKERPGPGVEPGLHRQHSKSTRALPTCTSPADFASISQN